MSLLEIKDLVIQFNTNDGWLTAVNGFSCSVEEGQTLGIVGESGSGKSQTVLSIIQLLASNSRVTGEVHFNGKELLSLSSKEIMKIRGNEIAMIFQDPMTCLNPYLTVGYQLTESLLNHLNISKEQAKKRALECMDAVKIPDATKRFNQYPHEFSGGMRQRIMIAMALLCDPKLLIADEPTTALDVTVQADIMQLLNDLKKQLNMTILLITHDLGVVAGNCDDVIVMYGGRIMERGSVDDIFYHPNHPYTLGLLNSVPNLNNQDESSDLFVIPGNPPSLFNLPKGCPFTERCNFKQSNCMDEMPKLSSIHASRVQHAKACHVEVAETI